jgi:outer membrane protein OmpA-like peptidoglycan-associated protein/ABC-type nitrate/sulfonate/bicarbonate transport system substrate-binding protein
MRRATLGFILIIIVGAGGLFTWKYLGPRLFNRSQISTSDSPSEMSRLAIGGDNYLGYWFLTSPEMIKAAARGGIQIDFKDDGGAYAQRLEKFAAGEHDLIVLPVNSYLQHGVKHRYPGVIVAAVCESRGADGIVAFGDKVPGGKVNDLDNNRLRFVLTPDSPSSFLLDLTIADFDLQSLRAAPPGWVQAADGSSDVLKKLRKGEGDVFILWEPDLSKALEIAGVRYLWGSDKFSGYIVDVIVAQRSLVSRKPELIERFLDVYFRTLTLYAGNRERMIQEMSKATDLKAKTIEAMMQKIDWFDLAENSRRQFGLADSQSHGQPLSEGVVNTIIACTDVMRRAGTFSEDPLQGNPYLITHSASIEKLIARGGPMAVQSQGIDSFSELDDAQWQRLSPLGTFRLESITFQAWNNLLSPEGKEKVDRIAQLLIHNYPDYRILVRGHTAPGGDEEANQALSLSRAQAVAQYLKAVHQLDPNRLRAEGLGSRQPLPQLPGESHRAHTYRLPRVEFVALERVPKQP